MYFVILYFSVFLDLHFTAQASLQISFIALYSLSVCLNAVSLSLSHDVGESFRALNETSMYICSKIFSPTRG